MARPRQISDEQILAATRARVLTQGPNVSLDVVAADLNVTTPALLKRFGTRRALMMAALTPPDPSWVATLLQGPSDGPLEPQLLGIFLEISDWNVGAIPCLSALRESGIPPEEVFRGDPNRGQRAMQSWLEKARAKRLVTATELEGISFAIFGALMGRAFTAHLAKSSFTDTDRHAYAKDLARVFARALTP